MEYEGGTAIDGVPGTTAPVKLTFLDAVGSKTGAFLPTGHAREFIGNTPVTLVDYAMPMVLLRASDLGLSGDETPKEGWTKPTWTSWPASNPSGWRQACAWDSATCRAASSRSSRSCPRPVTAGRSPSRYFMNAKRCHKGHAVTGALCIAAACRLPGSVAHDLATRSLTSLVHLEHPSGRTEIDLSFDASGHVSRASLVRTGRKIYEGNVIVPASAVAAPLEGIQQGGNHA